MKELIYFIIITSLIFALATSKDIAIKNVDDERLDIFSEITQSSSDERRSRAISSFNRENSYKDQCPGTVLTMSPGYATILKSHKGYGKVPYPSDYQV